jgi:predicted transcriptional regulator of viral defense system
MMTAHARDTARTRALRLVKRQGIARARDLQAAGVPGASLRRFVEEGMLEQPARGQYRLAGAEPTAGHTIAVAVGVAPQGIVCLLSALRLHDLGTQTPHEVWLLIGAKAWAPVSPNVPLRLIRSRNLHEHLGVEVRTIEGVKVRVTSPERTVVECFKHRNTVGLDVALEAMRDLASVFRMQNVMRPYLEASA